MVDKHHLYSTEKVTITHIVLGNMCVRVCVRVFESTGVLCLYPDPELVLNFKLVCIFPLWKSRFLVNTTKMQVRNQKQA